MSAYSAWMSWDFGLVWFGLVRFDLFPLCYSTLTVWDLIKEFFVLMFFSSSKLCWADWSVGGGYCSVFLGRVFGFISCPFSFQYVQRIEKQFLLYAYWIGLGILSSVGLGTGLHTFLLYLVRMTFFQWARTKEILLSLLVLSLQKLQS